MSASRVTEKWLNRGLWAIAFIFAGFLIGLGSLVVGDLPRVQSTPQLEDYVDTAAIDQVNQKIAVKSKVIEKANTEYELENVKLQKLNSDYYTAKENFTTWISSRQSTEDKGQNPEVLSRTKDLEKLKNTVHAQEEKSLAKQKEIDNLEKDIRVDRAERERIDSDGYQKIYEVNRSDEIKVFGYRLAVTLPLLLIAAWLFIKKRKSKNWPFVWGFIFFALFAFFVELVPYLPNYGGYIRYIVGIIVTFFIGRYSIAALQTYLEKQRIAEAAPKTIVKEALNYDLAQQRLSRGICPGCERPIDLKDPTKNFCVHCGTCVFNNCTYCQTRKNAFAKYCHSCGETAI